MENKYTYDNGELSKMQRIIVLKDAGDPNGEFDDIIEFEDFVDAKKLQEYINKYRQAYYDLNEINCEICWTNEECYKVIQRFLEENGHKGTFNVLYEPPEIYY